MSADEGPAGKSHDTGTQQGAEPATGGRRLFAYTVGCCLVGAGLALYALTRVWSVLLTARPGLSDLRTTRTGVAELPWLAALALVALAAAGALLATGGAARRVLGVLVVLAGAGMAVGAVVARARLDAGAAGAGATLWPVVAVAGAVLVTLGGWWTVRHGHGWPVMGARYERPTGAAPRAEPVPDKEAPAVKTPAAATPDESDQARVDTRVAWDALDRGEDPTAS